MAERLWLAYEKMKEEWTLLSFVVQIQNDQWVILNKKPFPKVPDEAIVKDEKPLKTSITPEEVESKDEIEYDRMKSADRDMDGDDNPDLDPEV